MKYTVRIHKGNDITSVQADAGTNLLDIMRDNDFNVAADCGGNGVCGKCRLKVNGLKTGPSDGERKLLGEGLLEKGMRLACYNEIEADLDIYTVETGGEASIITEGVKREIALGPLVKKKYVELPVPELDDQTADLERISNKSGKDSNKIDIGLLRKLPEILRKADFKVTLLYEEDWLIDVEPGNTSGRIFGIAFDIGTTTIAAYLYDLNTGRRLDVGSMLNPQRKFGADVITRIEYTMASSHTRDEMNSEIIDCVNTIISHFAFKNKFDISDIYMATFVGNTTMMHFLMNMDARNMAVSPFIPVSTGLYRFSTGSMGINMNKSGYAVMFPGVSAYIGADTVAAVLSSGMYEDEGISLLIDIGTNGEIVLGNREWLYSCSTAAGPAFEGANIRNGVGGVSGAIDTVRLVPGFEYTVIGGEKPLGICGSGIVDAIAGLLEAGLVDETGRLIGINGAACPDAVYENRLVKIDGMASFLIAASGETSVGTDIAITQKDIRELQNAKAAIAAGVKTLVKRAGIRLEDIEHVYLAGGFGSRLNIGSALKIGLLPYELKDRIESIGNAAGSGAVEGLLSAGMLKAAVRIKEKIRYIELSASADFTDEYIECMMFE